MNDWEGPVAGAAAVSVALRNGEIICANAGDSRAVLCRDGKSIDMSRDHKPTDEDECERIVQAGGFVADGRVNGSLALSRAIGDFEYKRNNVPDDFIANHHEPEKCEGHYIKMSVAKDGRSYTVAIPAHDIQREYQTK